MILYLFKYNAMKETLKEIHERYQREQAVNKSKRILRRLGLIAAVFVSLFLLISLIVLFNIN